MSLSLNDINRLKNVFNDVESYLFPNIFQKVEKFLLPKDASTFMERGRKLFISDREETERALTELSIAIERTYKACLAEYMQTGGYQWSEDEKNILDAEGKIVQPMVALDKSTPLSIADVARGIFLAKPTSRMDLLKGDLLSKSYTIFQHYWHDRKTAHEAFLKAQQTLAELGEEAKKSPSQELKAKALTPLPIKPRKEVRKPVSTPPPTIIQNDQEKEEPRHKLPPPPVILKDKTPLPKIKAVILPGESKAMLFRDALELLASINQEGDTKKALKRLSSNVDKILKGLIDKFAQLLQSKGITNHSTPLYSLSNGKWTDQKGDPISQKQLIETAFARKDSKGVLCEGTLFLLQLVEACEQVRKGDMRAAEKTLGMATGDVSRYMEELNDVTERPLQKSSSTEEKDEPDASYYNIDLVGPSIKKEEKKGHPNRLPIENQEGGFVCMIADGTEDDLAPNANEIDDDFFLGTEEPAPSREESVFFVKTPETAIEDVSPSSHTK
ncbi:MAG: hypothetical protein V1746_04630 [bacterium]